MHRAQRENKTNKKKPKQNRTKKKSPPPPEFVCASAINRYNGIRGGGGGEREGLRGGGGGGARRERFQSPRFQSVRRADNASICGLVARSIDFRLTQKIFLVFPRPSRPRSLYAARRWSGGKKRRARARGWTGGRGGWGRG